MIQYFKLSHIVTDAIKVGYVKDVTFTSINNKVQFFPNETNKVIEDFLLAVTPEMNVSDILVEIDKIGTLIERWRKSKEVVSVLWDPTIGNN